MKNRRKYVVDTCDLYKIAILSSQSSKPHTGLDALVLFMKKGAKTKEIQFVHVINDNSYTEISCAKVGYNKLASKNYSWNYNDYSETDIKEGSDMPDLKNIYYFSATPLNCQIIQSVGRMVRPSTLHKKKLDNMEVYNAENSKKKNKM